MKGLIQRVSSASVTVDNTVISDISEGILLFLGVERNDGSEEVHALVRRVVSYRIFSDDQGRMNRSLMDIGGALLVVPQFTLAADTRSGTRPGFSLAASPDIANTLFQEFVETAVRHLGEERVSEGKFGADMNVALVNDGPVTFLLEV